MRPFVLATATTLAILGAIGCTGGLDEPKTPKKNIGQPAPTAVTSAEPLWLSNDPTRKQSPTDMPVAR